MGNFIICAVDILISLLFFYLRFNSILDQCFISITLENMRKVEVFWYFKRLRTLDLKWFKHIFITRIAIMILKIFPSFLLFFLALCEDKRKDCNMFANVSGFCQKLSHYMEEYCRKSCGFCAGNFNNVGPSVYFKNGWSIFMKLVLTICIRDCNIGNSWIRVKNRKCLFL